MATSDTTTNQAALEAARRAQEQARQAAGRQRQLAAMKAQVKAEQAKKVEAALAVAAKRSVGVDAASAAADGAMVAHGVIAVTSSIPGENLAAGLQGRPADPGPHRRADRRPGDGLTYRPYGCGLMLGNIEGESGVGAYVGAWLGTPNAGEGNEGEAGLMLASGTGLNAPNGLSDGWSRGTAVGGTAEGGVAEGGGAGLRVATGFGFGAPRSKGKPASSHANMPPTRTFRRV